MRLEKRVFYSIIFSIVGIILIVIGIYLSSLIFPKPYSLSVRSDINGYKLEVRNQKLFEQFLKYIEYKDRRVVLQNQNIHPKKFLVILTDKEQSLLPFINSTNNLVYASSDMYYNSSKQQLEIYIHFDKKIILEPKSEDEIEERIMMAAIDQIDTFLMPFRKRSMVELYPILHKLRGENKNILSLKKP